MKTMTATQQTPITIEPQDWPHVTIRLVPKGQPVVVEDDKMTVMIGGGTQ